MNNLRIEKYNSGRIKSQAQYAGDKENGQWVLFFENGMVEWIGNYLDGKEVGLWLEWYENGLKKEEASYCNGIKVPINFWDENGNVTLKDGNGYIISKFGNSDGDVYYLYYENGVFTAEKKIDGVVYLNNPR